MTLLHFLLASLGVFALLQFVWIPLARHRLRVDPTVQSVRRAAVLALLCWVRSVALIATLTTFVMGSLLFVLLRRGGTTVQELSATAEALQSWRDRFVTFGSIWSGAVLVAVVGILGVYAYRSGKKRLEKAFRQVYENQINQIKEKIQRGELEELPPTAEMERLAEAYAQHQQILARVQADSALPEAQRQALVDELERRMFFIREQWLMIDVHRRINLKVDPDVSLPPVPRTRFEKFQTFLISQGLLVNLNRGTRLLYSAGLISLMVCLVGVYSPQVGSALSERVLALDDLRVRLSRELVQKDWEQAKTQMGPPREELTAARMSRAFAFSPGAMMKGGLSEARSGPRADGSGGRRGSAPAGVAGSAGGAVSSEVDGWSGAGSARKSKSVGWFIAFFAGRGRG
jgi:hypothetical protein